jgi:hypothetical protein
MKRLSLILPAFALLLFTFSSCDDNAMRMCFDADDRNPQAGQRVKFNASCSEGMDVYHWNFGDGRDTVTKTPVVEHVFKMAGYYSVSLHNTTIQVADDCPPNGNGSSAAVTIEVTQ